MIIIDAFLIIVVLALACLAMAGYRLWARPRPRNLLAQHVKEQALLDRDFLLEEFHQNGLYLEEEKHTFEYVTYQGFGEALSEPGGLANQARRQGQLARQAQMDQDRARYQDMLNQSQRNLAGQELQRNLAHAQMQDSQLLANLAQARAQSQGLLGGLGGIGSALGALGGAFGQGLVSKGGPTRFGDRDD